MLNLTIASLALSSISQSPFLSSSFRASTQYKSFHNINFQKSFSSFLRLFGSSNIYFHESNFEKILDTAITVNGDATQIQIIGKKFNEALSFSCSSSIYFNTCTFKYCITEAHNGGAIRYGSTICKNKQALQISKCIFYKCRSLSGGAFYACTSQIVVTGTCFIKCTAKNENNVFLLCSNLLNDANQLKRNAFSNILFMNDENDGYENENNFKCISSSYRFFYINSTSINLFGAGAFGSFSGIQNLNIHYVNILNNKGENLFSLQNVNDIELMSINIINNTIFNFPFGYSTTHTIANVHLSNIYFNSNRINVSQRSYDENLYPIVMTIKPLLISDVIELEKIFGENVKFYELQEVETGNSFTFTISLIDFNHDNFVQTTAKQEEVEYPKLLLGITIITIVISLSSIIILFISYLHQKQGINKWAEDSTMSFNEY